MPTLEERVAKLEAILGNWDIPPKLSQGIQPTPLPNGRYPLNESDYQLHLALDELKGYGNVQGRIPKIEQTLGIMLKTEDAVQPIKATLDTNSLHVNELYIQNKKVKI